MRDETTRLVGRLCARQRAGLLTLALVAAGLTACVDPIDRDNPWDPKTPVANQAKGSLRGRVAFEGGRSDPEDRFIQISGELYNIDPEGRFQAFELTPGAYLIAYPGSALYRPAPGRVVEVGIGEDIDAGDLIVTYKRGTIAGQVQISGGLSGAVVTLSYDGELASGQLTVSGGGQFAIPDLPAGAYELRARGPGLASCPTSPVNLVDDGQTKSTVLELTPIDIAFDIAAGGQVNPEYVNQTKVEVQAQSANAASLRVYMDGTKPPPYGPFIANQTFRFEAPSNGRYAIAVQALNGCGAESEPVVRDFYLDTEPPELVSLTLNDGQSHTNTRVLRLGIASVGAAYAQIQVDGDTGGEFRAVQDTVLVTVPACAPADQCRHEVAAALRDAAGNETQSRAPAVITVDDKPPQTPGLTATASLVNSDTVEVLLAPPSQADPTFERYEVASSAVPEFSPCLNATGQPCAPGRFEALAYPLVPDSDNVLRVRAVDRAGNYSSETFVVVTEDSTAPAAPRLTVVEPGDGAVNLTWEAMGTDIAAYRVYYGPDVQLRGTVSNQGASPVEVTGSKMARLTGFANFKPAFFGVTAVDHAGNESQLSGVRTASPGILNPRAAQRSVSRFALSALRSDGAGGTLAISPRQVTFLPDLLRGDGPVLSLDAIPAALEPDVDLRDAAVVPPGLLYLAVGRRGLIACRQGLANLDAAGCRLHELRALSAERLAVTGEGELLAGGASGAALIRGTTGPDERHTPIVLHSTIQVSSLAVDGRFAALGGAIDGLGALVLIELAEAGATEPVKALREIKREVNGQKTSSCAPPEEPALRLAAQPQVALADGKVLFDTAEHGFVQGDFQELLDGTAPTLTRICHIVNDFTSANPGAEKYTSITGTPSYLGYLSPSAAVAVGLGPADPRGSRPMLAELISIGLSRPSVAGSKQLGASLAPAGIRPADIAAVPSGTGSLLVVQPSGAVTEAAHVGGKLVLNGGTPLAHDGPVSPRVAMQDGDRVIAWDARAGLLVLRTGEAGGLGWQGAVPPDTFAAEGVPPDFDQIEPFGPFALMSGPSGVCVLDRFAIHAATTEVSPGAVARCLDSFGRVRLFALLDGTVVLGSEHAQKGLELTRFQAGAFADIFGREIINGATKSPVPVPAVREALAFPPSTSYIAGAVALRNTLFALAGQRTLEGVSGIALWHCAEPGALTGCLWRPVPLSPPDAATAAQGLYVRGDTLYFVDDTGISAADAGPWLDGTSPTLDAAGRLVLANPARAYGTADFLFGVADRAGARIYQHFGPAQFTQLAGVDMPGIRFANVNGGILTLGADGAGLTTYRLARPETAALQASLPSQAAHVLAAQPPAARAGPAFVTATDEGAAAVTLIRGPADIAQMELADPALQLPLAGVTSAATWGNRVYAALAPPEVGFARDIEIHAYEPGHSRAGQAHDRLNFSQDRFLGRVTAVRLAPGPLGLGIVLIGNIYGSLDSQPAVRVLMAREIKGADFDVRVSLNGLLLRDADPGATALQTPSGHLVLLSARNPFSLPLVNVITTPPGLMSRDLDTAAIDLTPLLPRNFAVATAAGGLVLLRVPVSGRTELRLYDLTLLAQGSDQALAGVINLDAGFGNQAAAAITAGLILVTGGGRTAVFDTGAAMQAWRTARTPFALSDPVLTYEHTAFTGSSHQLAPGGLFLLDHGLRVFNFMRLY